MIVSFGSIAWPETFLRLCGERERREEEREKENEKKRLEEILSDD